MEGYGFMDRGLQYWTKQELTNPLQVFQTTPHAFPWDTIPDQNFSDMLIFSLYLKDCIFYKCCDKSTHAKEDSYPVRLTIFHKILSYIYDTETKSYICHHICIN